jgi:hypothetical protein
MEKFTNEDLEKLLSYHKYCNFGDSVNDVVSLSVFSGNTLLRVQPDVKTYYQPKTEQVKLDAIALDIHNDIRDLGFISGEYTMQYTFHRNVIGDATTNQLFINEISQDRTEVTVTGKDNIFLQDLLKAFGKLHLQYYSNDFPNLQLKFDLQTCARIVNKQQFNTNELLLKLYTPLPEKYIEGSTCYIVLEMLDALSQKLLLIAEEKEKAYSKILYPTFEVDINKQNPGDGEFETWDSLLGTNKKTRQQLLNKFISGATANSSALLNIDYSNYANFIHFGSAVERLENFKYKLSLLEQYNATLDTIGTIAYASSSGKYVASNVTEYELKIEDVKSGFDAYEQFLYYESSSTAWPKVDNIKPYQQLSVTSSVAIAWFASQSNVALDYDTVINEHNLEHTIPFHIKEDSDNSNYLLFVNMVGQHFDHIWSYIEYTKQIHSRENKLYEGLSKDLVYNVLASFGWESYQGFHFTDLWEYSLGLDHDGDNSTTNYSGSYNINWSSTGLAYGKSKISIKPKNMPGYNEGPWTYTGFYESYGNVTTYVSGSGDFYVGNADDNTIAQFHYTSSKGVVSAPVNITIGGGNTITTGINIEGVNKQTINTFASTTQESSSMITRDELSKETWKRMLNNLPYLLKTKGTERGIKALLTTYGLPPTLLRVFEYGGPQKEKTVDSYVTYDKFSYSLEFGGGNKWINVPWDKVISTHPHCNGTARRPDMIECRFNTWTANPTTALGVKRTRQYIWSVGHKQAVWLESHPSASNTSSKYYNCGTVVLGLSQSTGNSYLSSSILPLYDNDWWNVAVLQQTSSVSGTGANSYFLWVAKTADHSNARITHEFTGSIAVTQVTHNWHNINIKTLHIGGDAGSNIFAGENETSFSGSIQEFRYWIFPPEQEVHDEWRECEYLRNHARSPLSLEAYHATGSYDSLVARWSLGTDLNRFSGSWIPSNMDGVTPVISSSHPSYYKQYNWFTGGVEPTGIPTGSITSSTVKQWNGDLTIDWPIEEERYFTAMPDLVGTREISDKIRIESATLVGRLDNRMKNERAQFDKAPMDSNRLGVYFAPHFNIDLDIAHDLAGARFDDYVGNPLDLCKHTEYKALRPLRQHYWKKHKNPYNFYEYLKILRHLDHALFKQIEHLIPARCNAQVGLLVKGNMLERPKIKGMCVEKEEMHYEGSLKLLPKEITGVTTTLGGEFHKYFRPYTSQSSHERRPIGKWENAGTGKDIALQAHTGYNPGGKNALGLSLPTSSFGSFEQASGEVEARIDLAVHHGYDTINGARYSWLDCQQFYSSSGQLLVNGTASRHQGGASYENAGEFLHGNKLGNTGSYDLQDYALVQGTQPVINPANAFKCKKEITVLHSPTSAGGLKTIEPFSDRGNIKYYHNQKISRIYDTYEYLYMSLYNNMNIKAETTRSAPTSSPGVYIGINGYTVADLANGYYDSAIRPVYRRSVRAQTQDYRSSAKNNLYFAGCKLIGSDFNMPVLSTVDGGPVVEFTETNPNRLLIGNRTAAGGDIAVQGHTFA